MPDVVPMHRLRGYLTPTPTHRALGLVCLGAGMQRGAVEPIRDRALGCHAAVLVTGGSGTLEWSRPAGRMEFDAPLLFFLRPGLRHSYAPDGSGWDERWVLFDGGATEAYTRLGYLPTRSPCVGVRDSVPVVRVMDRLISLCQRRDAQADVDAAAAVHELLVAARRHGIEPVARRTQSAILDALQAGACTTATVADYARDLRLSVKTLRAEVHRAAGCSPKEIIVRTRLNEAKSLLAESRVAISEVARLVGYDDPAYFSRIFTRRVGVTPREFRRQAPGSG